MSECVRYPAQCWRPIQYLGSKVSIVGELSTHFPRSRGRSVDLFSGTSVVSQALTARGPVLAVDDAPYAEVFHRAFFEGMRAGDTAVARLGAERAPAEGPTAAGILREERRLIESGDERGLLDFYNREGARFDAAYRPTEGWWARHVTGSYRHLVEAHFGGHFFGYAQARDLDWLFDRAFALGDPERFVALACALATMSTLAASPGKHFAQPLNLSTTNNVGFVGRRLMQDRRRGVYETFLAHFQAFREVVSSLQPGVSRFAKHDLSRGLPPLGDVDFVYADPPYTIDDYGRFYHVLDLVMRDEPFALSVPNGKPTKGRYAASRRKSAFASASRTRVALATIIRQVADARAELMLSYSANVNQASRARTISLEELAAMCRSSFRLVKIVPLAHCYRPLQPRGRLAPSSSEIALLCSP